MSCFYLFFFFLGFIRIFIGADDLHTEKSGVQRGRFKIRKKKFLEILNSKKEKFNWVYWNIFSIRGINTFWPHPSCYQSRSSRLQHSRRFQSVFLVFFLFFLFFRLVFFISLCKCVFYLNYDATTGGRHDDDFLEMFCSLGIVKILHFRVMFIARCARASVYIIWEEDAIISIAMEREVRRRNVRPNRFA
jgi:hypothetical protein